MSEDAKIEELAREIAAEYGLDPEADVYYGVPQYVYLPGQVLAHYVPPKAVKIWHAFLPVSTAAFRKASSE